MLDRTTSDRRTQLDQARAALSEVEAAVLAHDIAKAAAASDSGAYANWRARNDDLVAERERLSIVVPHLESCLAAELVASEDAKKRDRYAARQAANEALAARTQSELPEAIATIVGLAIAHAEAAIEDFAINQSLPEGVAPLISADRLARGGITLDREVLKTERVWLWVSAENGTIIGDQDVVQSTDDTQGTIPSSSGSGPRRCVRRLFDEISFHPAQSAPRLAPIWSVRLTDPDGPTILFDGTELARPVDALAALTRATNAAPRERPIEVELVPIPMVSDHNITATED